MAKVDRFEDLALPARGATSELWRWLYEGLRAAILDGRLRPGTKLPSSRQLAAQYQVSRGTVTMAFEQLLTEGYTQAQTGSGTFVAVQAERPKPKGSRVEMDQQLSRRAAEDLHDVEILPAPKAGARAFRGFEPAIDLFPSELWARVASRVLRKAPRSLYGQGDAAGYTPLRRVISEYVGAARGVRCLPEQVLVTSGTQQALDLLGRLLIEPGDVVWVEDPGYPPVRQALRNHGGRVIAMPVDAQGLVVEAAIAKAPRAKLAYVTPANQFPLGVTMSAERRIELLRWARASRAWIIEDDYDAEYRYFGRPVASLESLDDHGSVIYVGTFTKMLFNALRLGFMVLPDRLVEPFARARSIIDRHPPTLDQAILAEFISEGHFGRHVRKMRQAYADRMEVLVEAADKQLKGLMQVDRCEAGMRTIGWLKSGRQDQRVAERAKQRGLEVIALSSFAVEASQSPALILGFGGVPPRELRRGVQVLSEVLGSGTL